MAQQKIGFYGKFQPTGIDNSGAQRLQALAGLTGQVGDLLHGVGVKINTKEGQLEGSDVKRRVKDSPKGTPKGEEYKVGDIIPPEMKSDFTAYGQAFNKGAVVAYKGAMALDLKKKIAHLKMKHNNNPGAFSSAINAYKNSVLSKMPRELSIGSTLEFDTMIASAQGVISADYHQKERTEQRAIADSRLDSFTTDISREARSGNIEAAKALGIIASEEIDNMVEAEFIDSYEADQKKQSIYRESLEQSYRKGFDDILKSDGADVAQKSLDSLRGKAPKEWTADEWREYLNSQQADINRHAAKTRATVVEADKQARTAIKKYEDAASLGFDVSQGEANRIKDLVANTPYQDRFDRVNKTAAFSVLSLDARNSILNELATGNLKDVDDYSAMIKANSEINKAASKDGYLLGVQQGLVDHVPFDASDPESMRSRLSQADILSDHYGLPVSPLTDSEAGGLSESINEMTPVEKTSLANTLNEAPSVWGQIAEKNQPAFAMAGSTGDNQLMMNVFKGQELIAAKLVIAPKRTDYLPTLDDFVEDVYGAQDKSAIVSAAINHYAATANDEGIFDEGKFEESLSAVTGGIGEINGSKLELPRGVEEDDFEDFIDNFTSEEVTKLGGVMGYSAEEAAEAIQNGRIKSIGANKYIVMVNGSQSLFKLDGEPLTLEWTEERAADIKANVFIKSRKAIGEYIRTKDERGLD